MPDEMRPYFPVYASDWLASKELERLSPAAECMLIRLDCMAHSGDPYGYLTSGGKQLTKRELAESKALAVMNGETSIEELEGAIDDLLEKGIIKQDTAGTYYVPKMVRIGTMRQYSRACGTLGGNPKLTKSPQGIKRLLELGPIDWTAIAARWNALATKYGLRHVLTITDTRRVHYAARLSIHPEFWEVVERELSMLDDFARTGRWFDFEWIIKSENNYTKLAEGKFRGRKRFDNEEPDPLTGEQHGSQEDTETLALGRTGAEQEVDVAEDLPGNLQGHQPRKAPR